MTEFSRRIYIRTSGNIWALNHWGCSPITLEICYHLGKVSTSKFKAAIGQIWGVGMTLPLAHWLLISLLYIFMRVHKIVHSCWERQRARSAAVWTAVYRLLLDFYNTTTFYLVECWKEKQEKKRGMIIIDMNDKNVNDWISLCWFNLAPPTSWFTIAFDSDEEIPGNSLLLHRSTQKASVLF